MRRGELRPHLHPTPKALPLRLCTRQLPVAEKTVGLILSQRLPKLLHVCVSLTYGPDTRQLLIDLLLGAWLCSHGFKKVGKSQKESRMYLTVTCLLFDNLKKRGRTMGHKFQSRKACPDAGHVSRTCRSSTLSSLPLPFLFLFFSCSADQCQGLMHSSQALPSSHILNPWSFGGVPLCSPSWP